MTKVRGRIPSGSPPTAYVVEIEKWNWSYTFGLNAVRGELDPFMDFRHLTVLGVLVRPRRMEGEEVEFTVIPAHDLNQVERLKHKNPLAVGTLGRNRRTKIIQGHLSIPQDVLGPILSMLAAERLKFIVMNGTKIGRSHAMIRSYRFGAALSEDDLDDGE